MKNVLILAVVLVLLAGCSKVKNMEYIEQMRKIGESEERIEELIRYEKNNKHLPDGGYIDVTGRTVEEVATLQGLTLEEYIEEYDLPSDLSPLVSETEAGYTIPAGRMAKIYGTDFEALSASMEFPESIKEDTPWGVAVGEVKVGIYMGEENIESFKKQYNLLLHLHFLYGTIILVENKTGGYRK